MVNEDSVVDKDKIPSNVFNKELLNNTNFDQLQLKLKNNVTTYYDVDTLLRYFNTNLYTNYHRIIRRQDHNNFNKPMCCRNVNYYYDLLYGYIKSSKIFINFHDDLFSTIEEYWADNSYFTKLQCKREKHNYSIEKRCLLKQLNDYYEDKVYLQSVLGDNISKQQQYKKYYQDKWGEILKINGNNPELYFSIDCKSSKINGKYKEFLLFPTEICPENYKSIKIEDIKISTKSFESASETLSGVLTHQGISESGSHHTYLGETKVKVDPELPSTSWPEIFLPMGFSLLGLTLFSFIIYKFSPLVSWLHNYPSKNRLRKAINEYNTDELIENSENNNHYLLYHSVSH
ncbi:PIR Superfamily Protein [Plasmodium ovale curtisi]|uniref:PIR Superfamily Protein n=1 Tax=Plasmodium ovale curtisi TaxID=864141 RepID=A0A1A8X4E4_PLAOA|nr:PIR Superfamily Protein [Plasmodium ovale curtisi]